MAKQTMSQLEKMRVYVPGKQTKKMDKQGKTAGPKKLGKVHNLVFSPNSRVVVGVMVKRPDIAGMVKREDVFVALDSLTQLEGGLVCRGNKDDFDAEAAGRLGLDLDSCIIWGGADVICESGKFLGYVLDASFDVASGAVDCFSAQEGSTASSLVGTFDIPAAWVVRYDKGRMIVRDQAASLELSGGLAAKAGEATAAATDAAKQAASKAGAAASVAVDKGSHGLGKMIGHAKAGVQQTVAEFQEASGASEGTASGSGQAAKPASGAATSAKSANNGQKAAHAVGEQLGKTKGMFSGFMREFKDASK